MINYYNDSTIGFDDFFGEYVYVCEYVRVCD